MVCNIWPKHVGIVHNKHKHTVQIRVVGGVICADYSFFFFFFFSSFSSSPPPPPSLFLVYILSLIVILQINIYVPKDVKKTDNV